MLWRDRDEGTPGRSSDLVHALPRRSACRSLVPGQRGGWEEEGKEEEEEEAEDVEDSPVSALLLFVMSLTILSWVVLWPLVSGSHLFVAGLARGVPYVDFSGK